MTRYISILALVLAGSCLLAQNTTINQKEKTTREAAAMHKVMLIPFEPKLYMSEIDRSINAEAVQSPREIKYRFRDGVNEQLFKAFKASGYNVVDLMDDTLKYRRDI